MVEIMKDISNSSSIHISRNQIVDALEFGGWETSLADKILKRKKYCLYCSFELPLNAKTCLDCGKPVVSIDLSRTTYGDIERSLRNMN